MRPTPKLSPCPCWQEVWTNQVFHRESEGLGPFYSTISRRSKRPVLSSSLYPTRWRRPKGPKKLSWLKIYMDSYMANYGWCFMVWWKLCEAHLQGLELTWNSTYHVSGTVFAWESRALIVTWSRLLFRVWIGLKNLQTQDHAHVLLR